MSYFNDDQLDHMRDLADASKKGLTCPCGWFLKTECERTCNSAYGSPEKHIAGQADVLIARLRHLVSLNEPRHGGPYQGTAAMACVRAMGEAADRIASLTEQVEGLTRERDEQRVMFLYEADKHSEWLEKFMDMKRRAEVAESELSRLQAENEKMREALMLPDASRRLLFISDTLSSKGYFNRSDICVAFGVSVPQASADISRWLRGNPGVAEYDKSAKRYVRASLSNTSVGGKDE